MSAARKPGISARQIAVGLAGFFAFINLYSMQSILPLLSAEFGAGAASISQIMTASTLAVALTAPFTGTVADVLGRKRVIVTAMLLLGIPTVMCALAPDLHTLVIWRFIQGLVLPPVFAVTIAYIGDEWEPHEVTSAAGVYTSGAALGGFAGRFFTGVLADLIGWRNGLMVIAALTLAGAIAMMLLLPRETKFVRSEGLIASGRQMLQHFRNGQLLATYAVGFGVLFCFVLTFTYINFRLAAPPYNLSPTWLGAIFVVYLVGSGLTPLAGRAVGRFGRRQFVIPVLFVWMGGMVLTLATPLWLVLLGLTVCAAAGLMCQTISTGFVTVTAKSGRSSAVGLYVTSFYTGGAFGAALGGVAWTIGGWPACVALLVAMMTIMMATVYFLWAGRTPPVAPTGSP
ncbi:MFS transporter [Undibacter mobilis]|uniref:MFS transporter n=1 Tax=Undibacter mobilis TaxID=2292256 RepID=A0A371BAZ3_9BRAD|nr:MFS transporter [Undibacter mobilis]RDV04795.1 MFS transporter [Undibacter mobilis]